MPVRSRLRRTSPRRLRELRLRSPYSLDHHPVFASIRGTHIDAPNWRNQAWNPASEAAGLPWATPHTLRHSLASLLLENGPTIEQIAAWLGHEDSAFTLQTCVHTPIPATRTSWIARWVCWRLAWDTSLNLCLILVAVWRTMRR